MRRSILITGASSGLGEGMAREWAAQGRNLALCARRVDRLEALRDELLDRHPDIRVSVRALDVNDHQAVFRVFREFHDEFGTLDRIIVNAGAGKGGPVGTASSKPISTRPKPTSSPCSRSAKWRWKSCASSVKVIS